MKAHDNFYLLLGVSYGADAQHIRKCYRRLAKLCHPDKTGDQTDEFYKLKEAMDTLIEGKFAYDQTTFASSLVPLDFSAVVEERGDGFAVCVSWGLPVEMRETKPRFALLVRSDGFLRFACPCVLFFVK
jgi:curved DNA-binding protein CbpA